MEYHEQLGRDEAVYGFCGNGNSRRGSDCLYRDGESWQYILCQYRQKHRLHAGIFIGKRELSNQLRDIMCTLKWEIWEKEGVQKRSRILTGYEDTFLYHIMKQTENGYTVEEIERTRYHSATADPEDVFSFKYNLIPSRNNLFLFRALFHQERYLIKK